MGLGVRSRRSCSPALDQQITGAANTGSGSSYAPSQFMNLFAENIHRSRTRHLLLVLWGFLCITKLAAAPLEEQYRLAVERARAGDYTTALADLRALHAQAPQRIDVQIDLATVLSWAGHHAEAVATIPPLSTTDFPDYALRAFAQAARSEKNYPRAIEFYRVLRQRQPHELDYELGLALAHIDAGNMARAETLLDGVEAAAQNTPAVLSVRAYLHRRRGQLFAALDVYLRILAIDPGHREALRQRILLSAELGAPDQALAFIDQRADLVTTAERERIAAHAAALRVRWADIPPISEKHRFEETDAALARMDAIESVETSFANLPAALSRQLLLDRMVALSKRGRHAEVLAIYARLSEHNLELPNYALLAAATAYLTTERPEEAATLYRRVLATDPEHFEARRGLYYATLETEQFDDAYALIDELAASEAPWHISANRKYYKPNERRLSAHAEAIMARAFGDDLAYAEQSFDALIDAAPLNTALWGSRANVYRWRGWPRAAITEFQAALYLEPEFASAQLGRTHTSLDIYRFRHTEFNVQDLGTRLPENKHVQKLKRRWELHNRRELVSKFTIGESSGGTERGSDYTDVETWLYSQPISYNYRAYLHHLYGRATFPEGDGSKHRLGFGVEYRRPDPQIRASVELLDGAGDHQDLGVSATLDWFIDDYWQLGGGFEISTPEVPLRGQRQGVNGHRVFVRGAYRWHESQAARVRYSYVDFDDGNERHSLFGDFQRRLINRPKYKMTGVIEAYTSHNSARNRIYYNPEHDVAFGGVMINSWRLYRRYERRFDHRLILGAGFYDQRHFDIGHTWSIVYEHDWKFSDGCRLHYGIRRARRVYDGNAEFETAVYGGLGVLF